jgi:mannosylglycerate hydrolase
MDHLFFVVHTHWDREWYQPFQQMRARLVAMTDRMLPLVESGKIPHFHFDGQTIVLDDYLEIRPGNRRRLATLIKAEKIAIGPWYVLADSFLVSGESLIRNLEIGRATARQFGRPLEAGYLPDQFGHIAQMPQILAGFGFKTAVLWRGVRYEVNRNRFIWEGPDGSRVFTVYLPFGYSNGANLPLDSADTLLHRASEIASRERAFADGAPILVMNGTDHAPPDPRLMDRIAEAGNRDGLSFEVGRLEDYLKRLSEAPLEGVPLHRGELRSPSRAHLLPGVTSARTWIKQRDFENCALLERYADPLAALATAHGRGDGLSDFLELAWRTEIQNHPHDSICGCSVDQVHEDMRYRFDQAAMLGETVVRNSSRAILSGGSGEPALAVFNPTFGREALVNCEIELDGAAYSVIDTAGNRIPIAIESAATERAFDLELPASELKSTVAGLSAPQILGRTVNRYQIHRLDSGRVELELSLSRGAITEVDLARFRDDVIAALPASGKVRIRGANRGRSRVSFVAKDLAQAGFSFYRMMAADKPMEKSILERPSLEDGHIENEFYRVQAGPRGFLILDKESGDNLELYFEDDGDRGDEYNFDPIPGAKTISDAKKATVSCLVNEATRSLIAVRYDFEIPRSLSADRRSREDAASCRVTLEATLYSGLKRLDLKAEVENSCRDHRFRVAIRTPVRASEAVSDTSFGVIKRRLTPNEPRGTEVIYPTVPHRSVTAVESDSLSVALISRGLYEVEARPEENGTTILLTLLRCVGWLSRSDLATRTGGAGPEFETPGAQEQGPHTFHFAMTTYRGGYLEAELMNRSAAYTYPPRAFETRQPAARVASMQLISCGNPAVIFSTARLDRENSYVARAFSVSPNPEKALFNFGEGRAARLIDLAGRPVKRAGARRKRDGSLELNLRPFEIVSFRVSHKNNFAHRTKKD